MAKREQSECVYCGARDTTKEHIFGKWMRDQFPTGGRTIADTSNIEYQFQDGLDSPGRVASAGWRPRLARNGAPHQSQLKIACKDCNSGWMSRFQDNTKPLLLGLMKGNWPVTSLNDIRDLARWATMVTMSAEYADPASVVATKRDRRSLKDNGAPPDGWQVYLGLSAQDYHVAYWHRSMTAHTGHGLKPAQVAKKRPNVQLTTFHVGYAFFQVIKAPDDFLPDPAIWAFNLAIRQFWPLPGVTPSSPVKLLTPGVARASTEYFTTFGLDPRPHMGIIEMGPR